MTSASYDLSIWLSLKVVFLSKAINYFLLFWTSSLSTILYNFYLLYWYALIDSYKPGNICLISRICILQILLSESNYLELIFLMVWDILYKFNRFSLLKGLWIQFL